MEEQLVSFDTAKLADNKGFDWPTINYLNIWSREEDNIQDIDALGLPKNFKKDYLYSRPTQSLLQKWLRDVHGIHVTCFMDTDDFAQGYTRLQYFAGLFSPILNIEKNMEVQETYEKALEEGLLAALNLIK